MASVSISKWYSTTGGSFKEDFTLSNTYCTWLCYLSGNVTYNSTGKYYMVGPIQLYIKSQTAGLSNSKINTAGSINTSGNWGSFNFKPSKTSGSISVNTSSYTNVLSWSGSSASVSDTYTEDTKTVKATLFVSLSTTVGSGAYAHGISWSVNPITLSLQLSGGKLRQYTISYYQNNDFGGAQITSYTYEKGKVISVRSAYNRSFSPRSIPLSVSFDTRGGVPAQDSRDKSTKQSQKYVFDSWSGSMPGTQFTVVSDKKFVEQYHTDYGNINYKTIGSLPYVNRKGYKKTNLWYDQSGAQVSSSTQVTESLVLHPEWEALMYNVRFDLAGGKLKEEDGRISEYIFSKTYGVGQKLPSIEPIKLGYSFDGWTNQSGTVTPQGPGATMDDRVYNATYTDYTTGPVTLYAKWVLKPNTVWFDYWYNTQDSNPSHDIHIYEDNPIAARREYDQYNITQSIFEYGQPKLGYRTGDYVFLGWSDVKPDEYDKADYVNSGYHGVYNIPPDIIKTSSGETSTIDLPLQINPADFKEYNQWGVPDTYYGIWAKTGKYICTKSAVYRDNVLVEPAKYNKVSTMYTKVNGVWKKVVGAWTCTKSAEYDDQGNLIQEAVWKHEI